ncbi:ARM repeat-containing protein [Pilatotrama ljubarskyi]|nr:ARM repeat-containing protein [Pilatotrama ljubarskyi]
MTERIDRLVRTWIAAEQEQEVQEVASEIAEGKATLLDLVKSLGEYLTAEEDDLRTKGVELLSLVLAKCPPEKLNRQSVRVLTTFYSGKLEDTETIIPAIKGLATLTKLPAFTSSDALEVIKAIFAHVKMNVLVQSQRFTVFTIIDNLVARHRDALKSMGDEFLRGYINLAEGEKDPRNLLLAFAVDRVLLIEFDVEKHIEDFFNITFCYFPITFRPPPNDPYGITADDLKGALRACLHATPAFGPLAIPLFLEKLTAGSPVTKKDTLDTLDVCLPVYGPAVAREHARKLWNCLKLEIFQPTDSVTEEKALKTTQVLIQTIYSATEAERSHSQEIEGLAKDACEECMQILREPEKSQAQHAIKVLCAFMSTTPAVARFTLARAIPHLVKLFLDPDELPNRAPTLRLLSDLIEAARKSTADDPEVLPEEGDVPLSPYKDEVLGVLTVGLKTPSSALPAIDGLKSMVRTAGLLTDEELGFVVHNVNELLQRDEGESEISDAALDLLSTVSFIAPAHVSGSTLPLLFTSLPDRAPAREAEAERIKYWRTLAYLKKLCTQPDLFETLVVRLSTKLDLLCVPSASSEDQPMADSDLEPAAAYAHSILKTLADVLSAKIDMGHADVVKYIDRLIPRLYNLFIYSALLADERPMVAIDPRLLAVTAQIITLITQTLNAARQEAFVKVVFVAFLDGDVSQLAQGIQKIPADKKFAPLQPGIPVSQKNLVVLFAAALIALHKEVSLPVLDETELLNRLLKWTVTDAENPLQREAVVHMIAAILNRHADKLDAFLSTNLATFWQAQVSDSTVSAEARRHAILTFTWLTKALLVRGHPAAMAHVDRLFELFDDGDVNWDAARAVGRIPGPDKILTKSNHAVIKVLYAQKYCNAMLPRIIEGARTSQSARQNAYLVALAALIKSVPKSTYVHQMPSLMPLLLRSLDLPDNEVRASVIDTLQAAATSSGKDSTLLAEHASSIVSTMLKNSMVSQMPSVRVRVAALRYLATLPSVVRYDVLHPQKATVIRELAKVLDDPKRAVRKEAVEARTNWFKFSG